jgi:two-component system, cell cycle sensor histidine kinase and response regulator CckA
MSNQVDLMELADISLIDRGPGSVDPAYREGVDLKPLTARRTVLIVDDEPMMLDVLRRVFQKENFEILTATNGPDAVRRACDHGSIDLLVTDYAMPGMHGRMLAERLRAYFENLPVLYETGFTDLLFEERRELEERSAFLEKPFTPRGVREAARLMLFGAINPS